MREIKLIFTNRELIVSEGCKLDCIQYYTILYMVYDHPYTVITTLKRKKILIRCSLNTIENKVSDVFFRCNRYSIVNLLHIEKVVRNTIIYADECQLEITKRKKEPFFNKLFKVKGNITLSKVCLACLIFESCEEIKQN